MPYPALTDRRWGYDNDGSLLLTGADSIVSAAAAFAAGPNATVAAGVVTSLNSYTAANNIKDAQPSVGNRRWIPVWLFLAEKRTMTQLYLEFGPDTADGSTQGLVQVQASNDTTNGIDGSWETASYPVSILAVQTAAAAGTDQWRAHIGGITFTTAYKVYRFAFVNSNVNVDQWLSLLHCYGPKLAGQTPDDLLFIDSDETGLEFTAPEDFGDRALGTTVVRQFRIKNASGTKTANNVVVTCNDADFAISTDGITYVTTFTIGAIASGAMSAVLYVRNTTPAPGGTLGPRFARVSAWPTTWV